jgi:succinate dehydrogenase/fumarate reductase flavoprotein subunit
MFWKKTPRWNVEADVVVIGTGAAGMVAALAAAEGGQRVALLEKSDRVGGTTAVSGGVVWVPGNHHMAEAGLADSREEALSPDLLRQAAEQALRRGLVTRGELGAVDEALKPFGGLAA